MIPQLFITVEYSRVRGLPSLVLSCLNTTDIDLSPVLMLLAVLHTAAKARQSGSIKFLTGVAGMDVDVLDKANQAKLYN